MIHLPKKKYLVASSRILALIASWWVSWPSLGQQTNSDSTNTTDPGTSNSVQLSPLLSAGNPVKWWFVFKFNAATFPGDATTEPGEGIFGGKPTNYSHGFSLSYACASSADGSLKMGTGNVGTSLNDPVGATFDQIYHGHCFYVLWNDQFGKDLMPDGDSSSGHSKGVLAWDDSGAGFVMQVTTPSWPASGSANHPRTADGNTLGCVAGDDDVLVSQHFFALQLTAADVVTVLQGLSNASVVTKPGDLEFANIGGPAGIQALAKSLGKHSTSTDVMTGALSSGIIFISKPSAEHVPPWQMVSAEVGGIPIRAATWWGDTPIIDSTTATSSVGCWDGALLQPNAVQIATSGTWQGKSIGLKGVASQDGNHAKIGVSTDEHKPWCIFGDMNQQGTLNGDGQGLDKSCDKAQNGRGGTFYAVQNTALFQSLTDLLKGESDPPH